MMSTLTLEHALDALTIEGELYETHTDGALTCSACGHRCLIKPGKRGICKVRFNAGGKLRVPWGYVGALQCDPTEKKPFFHIYPGSDTLTFGMLGCDMHCPYCFPGDTTVVTNQGPLTLAEIFYLAQKLGQIADAEIAYPEKTQVVTASGTFQKVRAVFRHAYSGPLTVIQPYYMPPLRCTPDHRLYATTEVHQAPQLICARELTVQHYLVIPRHHAFSSPQTIETIKEIGSHQITYRVPWELTVDERAMIAKATAQGVTSREIGARLNTSGSYIRHVRGKLKRGLGEDRRSSGPLVEGNMVRFPNEHRPGIPLTIPLAEAMARLLGYYCAEGSVTSQKTRPNSHSLNFSFSLAEGERVDEVCRLLKQTLGVEAVRVKRPTTFGASASKASAALLLKALCGGRAREKHAPRALFDAPRPVVKAFLDAYVTGDGHYSANGKVGITTVSRQLAYDVAWLVLKSGYLPSVYDTPMAATGLVQGRVVKRAPHQYSVVWYEKDSVPRKVVETEHNYLIPIRTVTQTDFEGEVFNLEVENEHSYLAGFFSVSNCQNWQTSQTLRDPASELAGASPRPITPHQLITLAQQQGAALVGSSYNEPLITSEWAVSVFNEAARAGLKCVYISNGNATPEVLDYLRPHIVGYKIDLKTMSDKNYRRLGAVLENVLNGVRMVHERGLWLEIVTLIIPGFNDSEAELREAAQFLASLSPDIPWHVTAFHQDYKMLTPDNTTVRHLLRAVEIGQAAGLRYVYAGNLPGQVGEHEHTFCPTCRTLLIERYGYVILDYALTARGACPKCGTRIPGIWTDRPDTVRLGGPGRPRAINRHRSDLPDH